MNRSLQLSLLAVCLLSVMGLGGCASTPRPVQTLLVEQPIPPWPASVADTCPQRRVSVECFRGSGFPKAAVNEGMADLSEQLQACIRRDAVPVKVMLTIETQGGTPSCVDRSVRDNETALCAATVVARDLVIPESTPDETCRFVYPLKFAWDEEPGGEL